MSSLLNLYETKKTDSFFVLISKKKKKKHKVYHLARCSTTFYINSLKKICNIKTNKKKDSSCIFFF